MARDIRSRDVLVSRSRKAVKRTQTLSNVNVRRGLYSLSVARRVPIPLRDAVVQELRKMVDLGIIRQVEGPTDWCAGIVSFLKPSREVRICIDFTHLNNSVRRERYVLPTVEETLGQLGAVAVF